MVKKHKFLRKKQIIKKKTLFERKSLYYQFFGWRKRWHYRFLGVKGDIVQRKDLVEKSFLIVYETCVMF